MQLLPDCMYPANHSPCSISLADFNDNRSSLTSLVRKPWTYLWWSLPYCRFIGPVEAPPWRLHRPLRMLPLCLHKLPERVLAPQMGNVFRSNWLAATRALKSFFSICPHPLIDANGSLTTSLNIHLFDNDFLLAFALHAFKGINLVYAQSW